MVGELPDRQLVVAADHVEREHFVAEEPRRPYDLVALTSYFTGSHPEDLELGDPTLWDDPLVTLRRDHRIDVIDRDARTVT
ncbi:MAG: hypothetical protein QM658_17415, partial [Gordonia sp. (in: high G+C Gram-positive bacteria)]